MDTYNFLQSVKVRCWRRIYFDIEAENLEEARKKAMEFLNKSAHDYDCYVSDTDHYISSDDDELILPSEQEGHETIELYNDDADYPFTINSDDNYRVKDSQLYKLCSEHELARRELKNYHIECRFESKVYVYDAFHKDGKLNVWKQSDGSPFMYVFDESWDSLVKNEKFRECMAMWMRYNYKKSPKNDKLILDWMDGGLTKMWASSEKRTKEDEVPFSLEDLVRATAGEFATLNFYRVPELLGYQVAGENGELPDGYLPTHVFEYFEDARAILRKLKKDGPHKTDFAIYPVFEDEIENPCYIEFE